MLKKRLVIAFDLALWSIFKTAHTSHRSCSHCPLAFETLLRRRYSPLKDVSVLFIVYLVIAVGVVFWNFFEAEHALAYEPKLDAERHELDPQEQHELKRLISAGRIRVAPPLLERFAAHTRLIYRDVSGELRIESQYRWFLKEWNKRTRTT